MTSIDDSVTVRSGSASDPLVLLLHGYGSHEQDLPGLMRTCRPDWRTRRSAPR